MDFLQTTKDKTLQLAFLGVGWIGKNRMEAILKSGLAVPTIISDMNPDLLSDLKSLYPEAIFSEKIYYNNNIDGVVIATPNALHAEQAIYALDSGVPVFCQKPLARNYNETKSVVDAAKRNNLLLGVDFSYRYTNAFKKIYEVVQSGELGKIFSADLIFHNAYGPGKSWCYDYDLSGGGCVIDLGIHLVDLILLLFDFPEVIKTESKLYSKGNLLKDEKIVEDYASVQLLLENEISVNLNCSWNLSIGQHAVIEVILYGTSGTAALKNQNGSFFDFSAELYKVNSREVLVSPPDDWMGRAGVEWTKNLILDKSYNSNAEEFMKTAEVIDKIYGRTL
jgi:predicted dehydrogenase